MTGSNVPAIRAYLQAHITAAVAGLTPIPEVWTSIPQELSADDFVIVGGARRQVSGMAMMGGRTLPGSLKEQAYLTIQISSARGGTNSAGADAAAFAILDVVENVVRADPTCGGLTYDAIPSTSQSTHEQDDTGSSVTTITLTVSTESEM